MKLQTLMRARPRALRSALQYVTLHMNLHMSDHVRVDAGIGEDSADGAQGFGKRLHLTSLAPLIVPVGPVQGLVLVQSRLSHRHPD